MRYGAVLPNQTLKPTRVFWFAPRFVRTNRLEVSRARLSFVSLARDEQNGFRYPSSRHPPRYGA